MQNKLRVRKLKEINHKKGLKESFRLTPNVGHSDEINATVFSPDGKTVASCSNDCTIKIWDVETGTLTRTIGEESSITHLRFNSEGTRLFGFVEFSVYTWDIETGRKLNENYARGTSFDIFALSPDGSIAVTHYDSTLIVYDLVAEEKILELEGDHEENYDRIELNPFTISPDNRYIALGYDYGGIKIWDLGSGNLLHQFHGHQKTKKCETVWVTAVSFSNDSQYLITGAEDDKVRVWDIKTGDLVTDIEDRFGLIHSLEISPKNEILVASESGLTAWDLKTGQKQKWVDHYKTPIYCVAFSPDFKMISMGSGGHDIYIVDFESGDLIHNMKGHNTSANKLVLAKNCQKLACALPDGTIRIANYSSGKEIKTIEAHLDSKLTSLCLTPDEKYLVSGSHDKTIKIWCFESYELIRTMDHDFNIDSLTISPTGKYIVSTSSFRGENGHISGDITLWDSETGASVPRIEKQDEAIKTICITSDEKYIIAGLNYNEINVWDLNTGKFVKRFPGVSKPLAVFNDYVANQKYYEPITIRDFSSEELIQTFYGHKYRAISKIIRFSLEGRFLLSTGVNELIVWDMDTGAAFGPFFHLSPINDALFHPDSEQVLACYKNGDYLWWNFKEKPHEKFSNNAEAWAKIGKKYLKDGQYENGLQCLNKAFEIDSTNIEPLHQMAEYYYNQDKKNKAVEYFTKIVSLKSDDRKLWADAGYTCFQLEEYQLALTCYTNVSCLDTEDAQNWFNVGMCYRRLENLEKMLEVLERGYELDKSHTDILSSLGWILGKFKQYDRAIAKCDELLAIEPDDHYAWYNIACYESIKDVKEKALKALKKAIELHEECQSWALDAKAFDNIRHSKQFKVLCKTENDKEDILKSIPE